MVLTVEKMNYIEHHLKYDMERLICACQQLETTTEDDKSAFFVAMAAHMRSLRMFMRNTDRNTNMRGQDYNKEFKVMISTNEENLFKRLDKQVFHLDKKRDEKPLTHGENDLFDIRHRTATESFRQVWCTGVSDGTASHERAEPTDGHSHDRACSGEQPVPQHGLISQRISVRGGMVAVGRVFQYNIAARQER